MNKPGPFYLSIFYIYNILLIGMYVCPAMDRNNIGYHIKLATTGY